MGRLPKMKDRTSSSKSRASRRAKSGSPVPEDTTKASADEWQNVSQPDLSVLSARSGGGITKSTKGQKRVSRAQRLRKEKAMDMADAVVEKLERKVHLSKKRGKAVKDRAATWEELNSGTKLSKKEKRLAQLKEDMATTRDTTTTPSGDAMDVETKSTAITTGMATIAKPAKDTSLDLIT